MVPATFLFPKLAGVMAVTLTVALAASATVALVYRSSIAETPEDKKSAISAAALEGKLSLESRRRLEDLLEKAQHAWRSASGERLRMLRAIEALELAATRETREVLEMLAAGAEGARLTEEAKAALKRLQR